MSRSSARHGGVSGPGPGGCGGRSRSHSKGAVLSPGEQRLRGPSLAKGVREVIFHSLGVGGWKPIEIKPCCRETGYGRSMADNRVGSREGHAVRGGARELSSSSLAQRLRGWPIPSSTRGGRRLAPREANGRPSPQAALSWLRAGGAAARAAGSRRRCCPGVAHGGEGRGRAAGWGEAGLCDSSRLKPSGRGELSRSSGFAGAPVTEQG